MPRLTILAVCLLVLAASPTGWLHAQSIWIADPTGASVSADFLKPSFAEEESEAFGFFTASLFLTGRLPLGNRFRLIGEAPFSFISIDSEFINESEAVVGNPYVGLEIGAPQQPLLAEVGVRLPLASSEKNATTTGAFTDFDRFEAFWPDIISAQALFSYRLALSNGLFARLRGGPIVDFYTQQLEVADADVLIAYAAQGWYDAEVALVGAGFTGRVLLTEDHLLNERAVHHVGLSIIGQFHPFFPGLLARIPIDDDLSAVLDLVVGLSLTVSLE